MLIQCASACMASEIKVPYTTLRTCTAEEVAAACAYRHMEEIANDPKLFRFHPQVREASQERTHARMLEPVIAEWSKMEVGRARRIGFMSRGDSEDNITVNMVVAERKLGRLVLHWSMNILSVART